MRKLLGIVGVFTIIGAFAAKAAGPVYTIPADYEKIKKIAEGIVGTSDLQSVDDTTARNAGANLKAFVEGATGRSTTSTYSPTYFRAYGNNYRQYVRNAVGTDPGGTTSSRSFTYAGRNYRSLAQGMTGLGIADYRYYYYRNAGRNTRDVVYVIGGYKNPTTTYNRFVYPSKYSSVGVNADQFKQRADQTFYDTYINPNGLKKTFSSLSSAVTSKTAGLTPIAKDNKVSDLGGNVGSGSVVGILEDGSIKFLAQGYYTKTITCTIPIAIFGRTTYKTTAIMDSSGKVVKGCSVAPGYKIIPLGDRTICTNYDYTSNRCVATEEVTVYALIKE